MRGGWVYFSLVAACFTLTLAGCRTASEPTLPDTGAVIPELGEGLGQTLPPATAETESSRSRSLALFSQGLIDEYERDFGAALSNYQQAAGIDPDDEDLNLRVAIGLLQQKRQEDATAWMEGFCKRHPESQKSLFCLAVIYQAAGRLDLLEDVYRRLIRITPENAELYVELASLYSRRGKDRQAVKVLESAIPRADKPIQIMRALGGFYAQRASAEKDPEAAAKKRRLAIRTYERALKKAPDDTPLLFQLGGLYVQEEKAAQAMECFEKIEKQYPDNLQLRQRLALSFGSAAKETAVATLEQLAREQPASALVQYYLGEVYADTGAREKALASFRAAAALDPSSPSPFIKLALLQLKDSPDAALEALLEGAQKLPDDPRISEMAAYAYYTKKDYAKSVEYFARAREQAEKKPGEVINPGFYFNYAVACQRAGRLDEAAALLNTAFVKNPAYLDAYLQYAFRQKEPQAQKDAITVLENVGRIQPDEPNAYIYLGFLNSYLRSYKGAISAFEKAESLVEDNPQKSDILDASFYFWFAAACERDAQVERAEKLFMKCLELDPEHSEAYNYLAYMWAEKGIKLEQALEYIQKALKMKPTSGAFIDTLGWIYFMQGKYKEALGEINRATELIPDDPTVTDHLGDILFKLGDTEQALPHWERSFVLDPENEKVAEKLKSHGVDLEPLRQQAEELKKRKAQEDEKKAADEEKDKPLEETLPAFMAPPADMGEPAAVEPEPEEQEPQELEPESD